MTRRNPPDPRWAIRNRLNQFRGRQFEYRILRKLRREGFEVRRVLEHDGYTHGVDLQIFNTPWGTVPVQCKYGQEHSKGLRGLKEVRKNDPAAPLVACFYGYHRTHEVWCSLLIYVNRFPLPNTGFELVSFKEFVSLVKDKARALIAQPPCDTLPSDGPGPISGSSGNQ